MSGQDEEEDTMVPGFSYGVGPWWGKEDEVPAASGSSATQAPDARHMRKGPVTDSGGGDDFIPGFGAVEGVNSVVGRQSGPLPPQEDMFGTGPGHEEWSRGGEDWSRAGARQSRWGPRRTRF